MVGPNGSGKSNVVDAIAWVLGEQGAKALRGGKMEDVIFAGTAGRAPLGRAEVTLTIDNTDGALPIDYTEVSITRRMFRSGESEYEINGDSCRLLDIQELLSDSGIGREMHIIVGQGRLDADAARQARGPPRLHRGGRRRPQAPQAQGKGAAQARRDADQPQPADRPHRRAAPPAQAAGPPGRGGPARRRHPGRPARRPAAAARRRPRHPARPRWTRRSPTRPRCGSAARRSKPSTPRSRAASPSWRPRSPRTRRVLAAAQDTWYKLSALQERFRSTEQLARERLRHLSAAPDDERPGRDPEQLLAEAEKVREQEEELRAALTDDQVHLAEAVEHRQELERQLAAAERALVAAAKAIADRREGLARLTGQVNSARARTGSGGEEIERLTVAHADAPARAEVAQADLDAVAAESTEADRDNADLDARHAEAVAAQERAAARVRELSDAERTAEKEAATWTAREEALALGLRAQGRRRCAARPGRGGSGSARRLAGAAHRRPRPRGGARRRARCPGRRRRGHRDRRGRRGDAAAEDQRRRPGQHPDRRRVGAGDARLARRAAPGAARRRALGARPGASARRSCAPAVHRALRDVVLVGDLKAATALVAGNPQLRAVTPDGDVRRRVRRRRWLRPRRPASSRCRPRSRRPAATGSPPSRPAPSCANSWPRPAPRWPSARRPSRSPPPPSGRPRGSATPPPAGWPSWALPPARPAPRPTGWPQSLARAEAAREEDLLALAELEERLRLAEETPIDAEPSTEERDQLAAMVPRARQNEMEVRLAVRTAEERVASIAGRADSLARQAAAERAARERAAARRAARARGAAIARAVATGAREALTRLPVSLAEAERQRDEVARERAAPRGGTARRCGARRSASAASWSGSPARCTATRSPAPSSGCASSSWRPRPPRTSGSTWRP